ncbi:hypothetical protein HRAG_02424 [Helicobacter bilis ATCC 43879]|uniref:Uncharacterized protein n=1 Tax=Helicobacter bilis ATCC 43879 TaxID=613026 RepID=T5LSJ8_9HELI|nr:hypothetical protein HRAG_02424 [Helicobacter bilis ATCC 43879]
MLHVMFCYNLNIKQMLLYDGVIRLTCIYKGLNIFICFYVWHTMLNKQSINTHAKAYKVIVMQSN